MPQAAAPNATGSAKNPCEADPDKTIPTFLRLGNVCIVPIGFMDLTPFWRDKNAASSMGSNFGSVPYNNAANGNLSEFHFSEQNSRLGFRVDGDWKGTHFIGYNEFDFNGTSGSTNLAVSNGAIVPRLRLFWVDVRKGKVEFLAGQSWSMLTPNRNGLSALPGDLFYTQVIDINYMAGLTWTRQPGLRVLFHPNKQVTFGFSVEQADQYIGGSAGGARDYACRRALAALASTQLDAGAERQRQRPSYLGQPTFTPDFIAKLAFDPSSRFHFEVGGIESNFKTTSLAAPCDSRTPPTGGGLLFGVNAAVTKNFRLIIDQLLERRRRPLSVWAGAGSHCSSRRLPQRRPRRWHHRRLRSDSQEYPALCLLRRHLHRPQRRARRQRHSLIGYGYTGSANSQNRAIKEFTFGFNQTMWKNPRYGAINVMGQYEWLERDPWSVAVGRSQSDPRQHHLLRYPVHPAGGHAELLSCMITRAIDGDGPSRVIVL